MKSPHSLACPPFPPPPRPPAANASLLTLSPSSVLLSLEALHTQLQLPVAACVPFALGHTLLLGPQSEHLKDTLQELQEVLQVRSMRECVLRVFCVCVCV